MKTKTPRTDAMVKEVIGWQPRARAMNFVYLARQLEIELNRLTSRCCVCNPHKTHVSNAQAMPRRPASGVDETKPANGAALASADGSEAAT